MVVWGSELFPKSVAADNRIRLLFKMSNNFSGVQVIGDTTIQTIKTMLIISVGGPYAKFRVSQRNGRDRVGAFHSRVLG